MLFGTELGAWIWVAVVLGGTIILGLLLATGQISWNLTRFNRAKEAQRQDTVNDIYEEEESGDEPSVPRRPRS